MIEMNGIFEKCFCWHSINNAECFFSSLISRGDATAQKKSNVY